MIDLVNILSLSYNQAKDEYGKKEINTLIFYYYKSIEIYNEFEALNRDFELKLDSLKKQNGYSNKKIEKANFPKELQDELDAYKKKMDSLKTKE